MLRAISTVDKSVVCVPTKLLVIPANTSTKVISGINASTGEYTGILIQNVGANNCYYAIGTDCDASQFNGILACAAAQDANGFGPGQQLDCSNCGQSIYVFSVGGTTISSTILQRQDFTTRPQILNQ